MSSDYDTSGYDVAGSRRERPWQFLSVQSRLIRAELVQQLQLMMVPF